MSDLAATTAVEPPWALPDSLPRRPVHEPWVERVKRGPGPMLRSVMLIVMAVVLLVGAGTAVWVRYSMQQAVADGALPAQTRSLEYMARALAFRVEQQQKPLQSLATVLSDRMHEPREWLEALLLQPASIAQQFDKVQLADERGQLLLSLKKDESIPSSQLPESTREELRRGLLEGKPLVKGRVESTDIGLDLEFQHVVPVRTANGRLLGVLGGSHHVSAATLLPLDGEQPGPVSDLFLLDKDGRLLAVEQKGQWQLPASEGLPGALGEQDLAWLRELQASTVSERRGTKLWSVVTLPWTQWSLVKVSSAQDWVPGLGNRSLALLSSALVLIAIALLVVMALVFHPLTELFRKADRAQQRGTVDEVDTNVFGARWWQRLSSHDWGEAQTLRNALQALGRSREGHEERERQLQLQLQTLMDYAPVGLVVTQGDKVLRVGIQAARVLGYQPREMLDMSLRQLCASDQAYADLVSRIGRGLDIYGQFDSEVSLLRKDSSTVWVRLNGQSMQRMSRTWELSNKEGDERYLVWEVEDVTTQRMLREQSTWKAMHDPLTRLPDRAAFAVRLKDWLQECTQTDDGAAKSSAGHGVILYVDLDHFSQVNRQGGREVGDEVLGHIAKLIESSVRPHGWVARVGGDEFAVLMPGVSREQGMRYAQLLCMAIQDWEGSYQGQRYMLSASIGMLVLDALSHSVATAFQGADMACYAAKRKGRNRVEVIAAMA